MGQHGKRSLSQRWDELQPSKAMLAWACAGSIAATLVVGFSWGGWVTGGTAQEMAGDAGDEARGQLASVVCAESFMAAPDAAVQLAALKEIDSSYQQRRFVQDGGWATMPGEDSPDRRAVELCAEDLAKRESGQTADATTPPTAQ
jgi:hypothetical protein